MRRYILVLVVLVFAAVVWAQSTKPTPVHMWQYAEFGYNPDPIKPKKPFYWFTAPDVSLEAEEFDKIFQRLGGKGNAPNGEIDLLNLLGAHGWELAERDKNDNLVLKREVR